MNADLLASMLGGGNTGGSSGNRPYEGKTIISMKAGKMEHTVQPNGKYLVSPTNRRGQINFIWKGNNSANSGMNAGNRGAGMLKFEWQDRRTKATSDELTIFPEDNLTFTKVNTGRDTDRVYLLQYPGGDGSRRFFYWMQDPSQDMDDDNCGKVSKYLRSPSECAKAAGDPVETTTNQGQPESNRPDGNNTSMSSPGMDNAALMNIMQGIGASPPANRDPPPGTATSGGQVDTLSNILENLGMPQSDGTAEQPNTATPAPTTGTAATPSAPIPAPPRAGGTLTLADLQGAMAGLATSSPPVAVVPPGPPLDELASVAAFEESGILNNEETKKKLIELLPEGQQTEKDLMENLRSPQVQQALKSLTTALCSDMDSFHSVIANFNLGTAEEGTTAFMGSGGNAIQAFLDRVSASVQKDEVEEKTSKGDGDESKKSDEK